MIIYGIGTDIVQISRVEAALKRNERFAEKILGPDELIKFHARRAKNEVRGLRFLATRFSAKEAFSKAIGLGIRTPMQWKLCEILNEPSGKPYVRLGGALAEWFEARDLQAHVTVTDETDYAASFVVVEGRTPAP